MSVLFFNYLIVVVRAVIGTFVVSPRHKPAHFVLVEVLLAEVAFRLVVVLIIVAAFADALHLRRLLCFFYYTILTRKERKFFLFVKMNIILQGKIRIFYLTLVSF